MADKFAEALGQFCWNFSTTEARVRSALHRGMGVTPNVGNAALSGMTFDITKLSQAQNGQMKDKGMDIYSMPTTHHCYIEESYPALCGL
jgi:hypothetical protein